MPLSPVKSRHEGNWLHFNFLLGGKMTRYGMHVHQMLKTDESDDENGNKGD